MKELTDKQIEMLYEMSDIHFKWFNLYSPESHVTYESVLELNNNKMLDILEGCFDCADETINFIFDAILIDYKRMLSEVESK